MNLQAWQQQQQQQQQLEQQLGQQQAQLQRQAVQGGTVNSMSRQGPSMGMLSSLQAQLSQAEDARRMMRSPAHPGPLSPSQFMRTPVAYGGREEQQWGSEASPLVGWGPHQRGAPLLADVQGRGNAQEQMQQNLQQGRPSTWPRGDLQPRSHASSAAAFQDWGMASSGEQANQAWQPAQQAGMRHQQPLLPSMGAFHNPTPGSLLAQSLQARGGEEGGGLLPAAQPTHPLSGPQYQPPASPAARLMSPRQMAGPQSHTQQNLNTRHYPAAEGFSRPTPIRTKPAGSHSMGPVGGFQRQRDHEGSSRSNNLSMGFASPQRSGMGSQGRQPARAPGSPFDGNIEGHDDFAVLGSRFPVPGSPHGSHGGFEGLWAGSNRAQSQMSHHQQQQQTRPHPTDPPSFSPHKRQRQSAPGQALLPMDDFGLGDWVASDLGVDDMIMNSIGQAGWNPGLLDSNLPGGGAAEADAVLGGQTGQQPTRRNARPPPRPPTAGSKPAAKARKRGKGADRKGEKRKASLEDSSGVPDGEGATAAAEEAEEVIEYFVAGHLNQGSPTLLPPSQGVMQMAVIGRAQQARPWRLFGMCQVCKPCPQQHHCWPSSSSSRARTMLASTF